MKIAFTISTANYLAQAKTLGDSLLEHNPDYKFVIGLLDRIEEKFDESYFLPHQIIEVEGLNIPYLAEMNERYTIFELSNALKPFFAEYILNTYPEVHIVLYFDSDMMVFNELSYVEEVLQSQSICITAHILSPTPADDYVPAEVNFLSAGIYNGGFFGLRPSKQASEFIDWWKDKLRYLCFVKTSEGLFVDQIWLNFVPLYYNEAVLIRHLGYNVAFYNMHERHLSFDGHHYKVNNNEPLVLFHFTGFDINDIYIISKWQNRFKIGYRPDVKPLLTLYKEKLLENNYSNFTKLTSFYTETREKVEVQRKLEKEKMKIEREHEAQAQKMQLISLIKEVARTEFSKLYNQTLIGRLTNFFKSIIR